MSPISKSTHKTKQNRCHNEREKERDGQCALWTPMREMGTGRGVGGAGDEKMNVDFDFISALSISSEVP